MSTRMRMMVIGKDSGSPLRDDIVNTFYLVKTTPDVIIPEDFDALAQDTADLWASISPLASNADIDTYEVRVYNLDDAEPREPRATKTAEATGSTDSGPREVALCLSYFSERNLPRQRGRMYLGPFNEGNMRRRPSTTLISEVSALAAGIQELGGVDIDWNVYSPTDNEFRKVTDWWIDNEWDTVRSRGLKADARLTGTTSE